MRLFVPALPSEMAPAPVSTWCPDACVAEPASKSPTTRRLAVHLRVMLGPCAEAGTAQKIVPH